MTPRTLRRWAIGAGLALALAAGPTLEAATYIAFEQIVVDNTAGGKAFTAAKITPTNITTTYLVATVATCRLELAEIRYTLDTTAPTTTVGTLLEVGDYLIVTGHDLLDKFRAIRTTATSGQLDCHYTAVGP